MDIMDGLTKYMSLLADATTTMNGLRLFVFDIREIPHTRKISDKLKTDNDVFEYIKANPEKIRMDMPYEDYLSLLKRFDKICMDLQSVALRLELVECIANMDKSALQMRLDVLSWKDYVGLDNYNMSKILGIVRGNLEIYEIAGVSIATARPYILTLNTAYTTTKGEAAGSIPKAIYFLTDKAQKRGYSFKKGTFLHSLVNSYGVNFDDDYNTFELPQRAKGIFNEAIEAGLMEEAPNGHYKWLYGEKKGKVRLAFFLQQIFNPDGCSETPYKELETLFQTKDLAQSTNQIGNWKQTPLWCNNILKITNKHLK